MKKNLILKVVLATVGPIILLAIAFVHTTNAINNRIDNLVHRIDIKIDVIESKFDHMSEVEKNRFKKLLELSAILDEILENQNKMNRIFNSQMDLVHQEEPDNE